MTKKLWVILLCLLFLWSVGVIAAEKPGRITDNQVKDVVNIPVSTIVYRVDQVKYPEIKETDIRQETSGAIRCWRIGVKVDCSNNFIAYQLPFKFSSEGEYVGCSYEGTNVENFGNKGCTVDTLHPCKFMLWGISSMSGEYIELKGGVIAYVYITAKEQPKIEKTTWDLPLGDSVNILTWAFIDKHTNNILSGQEEAKLTEAHLGQIHQDNEDEHSPMAVTNKQVPIQFTLSQNYPNPFNPFTMFSFTLPEARNVNVVIYNVAGQKIRNMYNGQYMQAGTYQVAWDGTDDSGNQVASGIYFYRLAAGPYQATKKMTLLK